MTDEAKNAAGSMRVQAMRDERTRNAEKAIADAATWRATQPGER